MGPMDAMSTASVAGIAEWNGPMRPRYRRRGPTQSKPALGRMANPPGRREVLGEGRCAVSLAPTKPPFRSSLKA